MARSLSWGRRSSGSNEPRPANSVWMMAKDVATSISQDRIIVWSAAIAYYMLFSLAPLLLIAITIAGFAFGDIAARGAVEGELQALIGSEAAAAVQQMLAGAYERRGSGIVSLIVGTLVLLWGATSVFGTMQQALHDIYGIRFREDVGWWAIIRSRLVSLAIVIAIGFVLLAALVVTTVATSLMDSLSELVGITAALVPLIDAGVSLAIVTVLVAILFRYLPEARLPWRALWIGAFVTALLFTVGKFLISLYLNKADIGSAYGSMGSIILLIVWANYATLILLVGAEITRALAERSGSIPTTPLTRWDTND